MAGVEIEIGVGGMPDGRHVGRRRRAQAAPEFGRTGRTQVGEQLAGAPDQRLAAHRVEFGVVAGELGGAGDAQALAEARENELVAIVGQADGRRDAVGAERQRRRIALGRIDRQTDAERAQQARRVAAAGGDVGVGDEHLAAGRVVHQHAGNAPAAGGDLLDRVAIAESHSARGAQGGQALREAVRVARLVARRVVAADQQRARGGERRFDFDAALGADRFTVAAEGAHCGGSLDGARELAAVGVDVQDAAFEMVVGEAVVRCEFGAQRLQALPAVERERDDVAHVGARAPGQAFAQEAQAPVEQRRVPARAEEQRRVFAPHPGQRLQRRVRRRPGLGVRNGYLAAVGEAGFEAGGRLPVEHRDFVAGFRQIPGAGDTDDAGPENQDFQDSVTPAHGQCARLPGYGAGRAATGRDAGGRRPAR